MTIFYLDTSALVKLYVEEEGSDLVRKALAEATVVATSQVAYAEARAAFSRAFREGAMSREDYQRTVTAFRADWDSYLAMAVSDQVIHLAGDLTELHFLRGFDAIHLASLLILQQRVHTPVTAACWDLRLWEAMRASGFSVLPE